MSHDNHSALDQNHDASATSNHSGGSSNAQHANAANGSHSASSASKPAIEEPSFSPQQQQQLQEMRAAIRDRFSKHGIAYTAGYKPPITQHWRDLYHQYRHLTAVIATPDPRLSSTSLPVVTDSDWPDYHLHRFLKARSYSVSKAVDFFVNNLAFRVSFGIDDLLAQPVCPFMDLHSCLMPERLHHTDADGRPVWLNWLGAVRTEELGHQHPAALSFITEIWLMEEGLRAQKSSSETLGRRVSLFTVVLQGDGLSLAHRRLISLMEPVLWVDDNIFPECMQQLVIINAPPVFKVLWAIVSPMIDAQTRSKFCILGANYQDELRRRVGRQQLPRELGGDCSLCGDGPCLPALRDYDQVMRVIGKGTAEEAAAAEEQAGDKATVSSHSVSARHWHEVQTELTTSRSGDAVVKETVTLWWSFSIDAGRDLDLSLSFHPRGSAASASYLLIPPTRCKAADGKQRGCWHFTVTEAADEGTATLRLSNAMSVVSAKKLSIATGIRRRPK